MTSPNEGVVGIEAPQAIFETDLVLQQAASENFPVATRLIPARYRRHLTDIYGFCRLVDDLGDEYDGDRLAALEWAERELHAAFADSATHPLFRRLQSTIIACSLDEEPFLRLIEANRLDQRQFTYETYADLLAYCELSANPVGRLVLSVFGASTREAVARSDEVCTALQLIEHLQDVREDLDAGRIYLPQEDLRRFGVRRDDLFAPSATEATRRLIAFEAGRASGLLSGGKALLAHLHGAARAAVAGFVGGGLAQLNAFEHAAYDVLARNVKASSLSVARRAFDQFVGAGGS